MAPRKQELAGIFSKFMYPALSIANKWKLLIGNESAQKSTQKEGGQFLPEQAVNIVSLSRLLAHLPASVEPGG